uniref:Arginine biosynthesis bifunctional protein ArgJ, chloroplastic n=1 Tax=Ostreococcus mediterraneus TaxID=1486918 RepID=A0A7S0Z8L7_9CHLO|mmetsp:Transcript_7610/g.17064  ORF Transcript_7610/g.17064 Transcript_7610/m.17064 type:complete len:486 (+) Transcript_7610:349-1806(+)
MALANVNVCGPKTARVCAKSMKMDVGAKVGRPGAMSRVVRVRASAEKIDFNYEGAFTLPYAPVREALLPDGPWTVIDGGVCAAKGFKVAGYKAGLRKKGTRADCALIVADEDATCAGIFTTNLMCAAPVAFCKKQLAGKPTARALLINAGQANAATGDAGFADSQATADALSKALGVAGDDILLMSTGVIGQRIKMDKLLPAIDVLAANVEASTAAANAAATAICTTDLVRKTIAIEVDIGGKKVRMGGMAKGSGMIHPNMATMLGVVTCDAAVSPEVWRGITSRAGTNSFNQISVDGDTSTNDSLVCFASGKAGNAVITDANSADAKLLEQALTAVCRGLAKAIAWDGEGATCLIECNVSGAMDDEDARVIARSVVCSSLAKAAIFGHDPNWGRLACAAGYASPVKHNFNQNDLKLSLGPHQLMDKGQPLAFDAVAASQYLKDVTGVHGTCVVDISVGSGPGKGQAWGCDLSYDYVKINAEYTT